MVDVTHHKINEKIEAWERGDNDNNTQKRLKKSCKFLCINNSYNMDCKLHHSLGMVSQLVEA
jgi:hypothetical protein